MIQFCTLTCEWDIRGGPSMRCMSEGEYAPIRINASKLELTELEGDAAWDTRRIHCSVLARKRLCFHSPAEYFLEKSSLVYI